MRKALNVALIAATLGSTAIAGTAVAQPASPASKLSLNAAPQLRAATPGSRHGSKLVGPGIAVILAVAGIIAGGVIVATNNDDSPDSP